MARRFTPTSLQWAWHLLAASLEGQWPALAEGEVLPKGDFDLSAESELHVILAVNHSSFLCGQQGASVHTCLKLDELQLAFEAQVLTHKQ